MYMLWVYRYLGWFMLILGFNTLLKPFSPSEVNNGGILSSKDIDSMKEHERMEDGSQYRGITDNSFSEENQFLRLYFSDHKVATP